MEPKKYATKIPLWIDDTGKYGRQLRPGKPVNLTALVVEFGAEVWLSVEKNTRKTEGSRQPDYEIRLSAVKPKGQPIVEDDLPF